MKLLYLPTANASRDISVESGLQDEFDTFLATLKKLLMETGATSILLTEFGRIGPDSYARFFDEMALIGYATVLVCRKTQPAAEQTNAFCEEYANEFAIVFLTKNSRLSMVRHEISTTEKRDGTGFFRNNVILVRDQSRKQTYAFVHLSLATSPTKGMETVRDEVHELASFSRTVRVVGDFNLLSEVVDELGVANVGWLMGNEGQPDFVCSGVDWIPKRFIDSDNPRNQIIEMREGEQGQEVRLVGTLSVASVNWPQKRFLLPDLAHLEAGTADVTGLSYLECSIRMPVPPAPFDHYACFLTDE